MLRVHKSLHLISDEIDRWKDILYVPYQKYLMNGDSRDLHSIDILGISYE